MARQHETIRQALRDATAAAHHVLDTSLADCDLADPGDYAAFLRTHLRARDPIEVWVAAHCPPALQCPSQTALIAADLAALGEALPEPLSHRFAAPSAGALGVAWALGGSSLGNRAMLAGLRKRGAAMPVRFLSDEAMPVFFARMRRTIEQPAATFADLPAAIAAAQAVFAIFSAADSSPAMKQAA